MITRVIHLGDINGMSIYITGCLFIIPFCFFVQDIVTEVYGHIFTMLMIVCSVIVLSIYILLFYLTAMYDQSDNNLISNITTVMPKHTIALIVSLLVGGFINSFILNKLRIKLVGKFLAIRFIFSTAIGEAFFQTITVLISWYGTFHIYEVIPIAILAYIYKVLFEIAMTPISVAVCDKLTPDILKYRDMND
ncbi:VUT family protein [Francisella sp. TX07-6608]|uniref:VUT family protein n=1 Tax=Francisella sp. TX07-6608 TaxID=573568 RepID=UPI0008F9CC11|nr:VUT family protein [Francisella sp. TX07-6608]OIN82919.1 hypothetical protein KX00_2031 [Francisella sp. TX07-6608]